MQSKSQDKLKQRRLLKEELKEHHGGVTERQSESKGLSGEGSESALAHIRDMEEKRADRPDEPL